MTGAAVVVGAGAGALVGVGACTCPSVICVTASAVEVGAAMEVRATVEEGA